MGSKHGVAYCRGKSALHSRLNIYTASSFVTPKNEFSTELVNHVILFPCPQAEPQEPPSALSLATDPTDEFHSLSFYSSLVGPAMITPVIQTLTVDDTPIWLLSFRVPVPGSYTLKVAIRYFNDFNQRRYIFFGESEARPTRCPSESCGHRTQGKSPDGKPLDCNVESSVLTTDVVVTGPSPSQSLIGAKTLPLAENSDRSPDAAWIKIAENAADCTARLDEINSIFSGNPCRIGGSSLGENHPIYAYQPSDKRYHFYTSGEIASCFEERNINSILIQGDSQARAVYSTLPMLLGDLDMGPDYAQELKEKLKKNDDVGGDTVENLGRGKIKVVYKQEWHENFALVDAMFDSAGLFKVGGPEVFIYNAGAPAHKGLDPTLFAQWWNDKISDPENVPPKVCVFILPVTIQGQRNYFWAKSSTAVNSEKMEIMFKQMGFAVLFLDQLTIGWPIATTGEEDGFHYGFNAMAMASMITINLICNIEAIEFNEGKFFEVGKKLEFDKSKKAGRMYSYEFVEYKNKFGNDMTVAVPHPAISEQFEEEGKHVNPCNCFDVQLIPYNLVDVFTFSLWNE